MDARIRTELLLLGAALALPLPAAAQARGIFCCEDDKGVRICGDVLPTACFGRAYREISPQGTLRRQIAAPLTAEEIARKKAEELERQASEERQRQQRRQDQALLDTYTGVSDLETQRARNLAELDRSMKALHEHLAVLQARRQKLVEEQEFYHGRETPPALLDDLRSADNEIAAQQRLIATKQGEIDAINTRFDDDRRRLIELRSQAGAAR